MELTSAMFERFGVSFSKGDIIFCEYEPGDNFYLIQNGRVEIVKILGDIEKKIDVLEPGEIFGEMAILEEAPRSATAIALDNMKALEFNRENFQILMQGNPQIALKLFRLFTKRIYDQKRRFLILTLSDVEARVADVFLMLAEREIADTSEGQEVELATTIEDIAHWAGMTPVKCKEIINHFVAQRRLELFPTKITVKNISDFTRFVSSRRKQKDEEE